MGRGQENQQAGSSSSQVRKPRRSRASPARLVKLYNSLTSAQKKKIESIGFGGLLKIACDTLPAGFADWLLADCFDAEKSELVFPGRGRILVNADSVFRAFDLPNSGDEVKYELDVAAINFIHEAFGLDEGMAPSIDSIVEKVKTMRTANDDFLRSWLMIAISTFLCPSTGLSISPRCYPAIVDVSSVNKLNWCQFVVDQLRWIANNKGKRKSFKGCLLFLVIVYVDSLVVDNIDIPPSMPRISAWARPLLDQVIKLDTNHDGSFGKLKLKGSAYSTPQTSLVQLDDICRFVSSKVPRGTSDQKKRKLNSAVSHLCSAFTEFIGTFLEVVSDCEGPFPECEAAASPHQPSSKRPKVAQEKKTSSSPQAESSAAQRHRSSRVCNLEEAGPSYSKRQTRSSGRRVHFVEDASLLEEDEDELLSDECTDEDEEDSAALEIDDSDSDHDSDFHVHYHGTVFEPEDQDHDSQDQVPLQVRLESLRALKSEDKNNNASTSKDPQPIEIIPAMPTANPKSKGQAMKEKLRLPSGPLSFTPPEINIMKFVIQEDEGNNPSSGSLWSLSDLPEDVLAKMENDALVEVANNKKKNEQSATANQSASRETPAEPSSHSMEPTSVNCSVTPIYQPHPIRIQKRAAACRSPYIDFSSKRTFNCSKQVCDLYAAVCAHGQSRTTTSSQSSDVVIINYWAFYVTLGHLASSVKPGGNLHSTVAEIAIHTLDDTRRNAVKRVLPLRVATFIQEGNLTTTEVSRVFRPATNHLDHHRMVMFLVLEMLGDRQTAEQAGHYFLLVLNLRNKRFEVLDSMRTLQDENLSKCCNTLTVAIKDLWKKYMYEEKTPINDYEVVDIGVPVQNNNHDCGFHMLMHAEHWDGRSMYYFKESDIPNIRKLLLYKWVTHQQNDVDWKTRLNL